VFRGRGELVAAAHLAWHPEGVRDGAARFFEDGELRLGRWALARFYSCGAVVSCVVALA
jgi:hypothetical protein